MEIKTIKELTSDLQIIEKSKFYSFIMPISSKEDVDGILNEYRKKYYDATHVCYAYILNEDGIDIYKSNDDGEPSSTAGAPILNALKAKGLQNVICIVVRYFGGVKLGTGGLVRAYSTSCTNAIEKASIITKKEANIYKLTFKYNMITLLDRLLDSINAIIIDKNYEIDVTYKIVLRDNNPSIIKEKFPVDMNIEICGTTIVEL